MIHPIVVREHIERTTESGTRKRPRKRRLTKREQNLLDLTVFVLVVLYMLSLL